MTRLPRTFAVTASLCLAAAAAAADMPAASLSEALLKGVPSLDLRLRHEHVGQSNVEHDAEATTLRAAPGYTTRSWHGWSARLELEGVLAADIEAYNSTGNGVSDRPVVADPQVLDLNQGWLRYSTESQWSATLGRQRLVFDNARYLGNVGWRQDEQTYDALLLEAPLSKAVSLRVAHLGAVNSFRRYGANRVAPCALSGPCTGTLDLDGNLLNVSYVSGPLLKLVGYGYWLDFDADTAARRDTRSLGLRATGNWPLTADARGLALVYALEAAEQRGIAQSPTGLSAGYRLAELGLQRGKQSAKFGYEVLGGDGGYGYQTPWATLHAFNGWADQFLVTPANGLRDSYVQISATVREIALIAAWHDYRADAIPLDYGREWNLQAVAPLRLAALKGLSAGLKWAHYQADRFPLAAGRPYDSTKAWAWLQYQL